MLDTLENAVAATDVDAFDVHAIRRDFPILAERVNGHALAWFDNGSTTHKPQVVIDRLHYYYYSVENSNIHRAAHALAARATDAYEGARARVQQFINAPEAAEVIFQRGATEAINLVARSWGGQHVAAGDEIIVSHLEHHANIVPWQQLAASKGDVLRVIPVDDSGQLDLDAYRKLLNPRTKIVAVTQVSNVLGTVTPVKRIVALAHAVGAKVPLCAADLAQVRTGNDRARVAGFLQHVRRDRPAGHRGGAARAAACRNVKCKALVIQVMMHKSIKT